MPIFSNDTFSLTLLAKENAQGLLSIVNENRDHLKVWLPWVDNMQTEQHFDRFIEYSLQKWEASMEIPLIIMQNETVVGRIGIYHIDPFNKIGSIGYWLGKKYTGQGLITQACTALIDYAFKEKNFNRLELKCGTENVKSKAIAERLHFTYEGTIRQGEWVNEKFIDILLFSKLRNEWIDS